MREKLSFSNSEIAPVPWADYELIDSGDYEKLERFGAYITIRPETHANWPKALAAKVWLEQAHVRFVETGLTSGTWEVLKPMPSTWTMGFAREGFQLTFNLELTKFKHVGVFPEQAANWDFIYTQLKSNSAAVPRFLNLFAYTGGASLAAKAAGADVYHVDSIKQVVSWARKNMESSQLDNIRWVVEDALKFVQREVKRGSKYHGIILDPPAFGYGPKGESWKLEKQLEELLRGVFSLLEHEQSFLILNTYTHGFSQSAIGTLTAKICTEQKRSGHHELAELVLPARTGSVLPLGVLYRFTAHV
jgi:23S rRNA (cytosine1962-C5)-methyltransferase